MERIAPLSRRGLRGNADHGRRSGRKRIFPMPAAPNSPIRTGEKFTAGRAEVLAEEYRMAYAANRDARGGAAPHRLSADPPFDRPTGIRSPSFGTYLSLSVRGARADGGSRSPIRFCFCARRPPPPSVGCCASRAAAPARAKSSRRSPSLPALPDARRPGDQPVVAHRAAHAARRIDHSGAFRPDARSASQHAL